jgi:hypothetical protein
MRVEGALPAPPLGKQKMLRVTVAPGRNINIGDPPFRWEGEGDKRRRVIGGGQQVAEPGDIIELPEHEARFLMSRGFLLDPDGKVVIPNGMGPDYDRDHTKDSNPAGIGMQNTMVQPVA